MDGTRPVKPGVIFSAVAAICILMGAFLPHLAAQGASSPAPVPVEAGVPAAAAAFEAVEAAAPALAPEPTPETPIEELPVVEVQPEQAVEAAAAPVADDLPVFHPPARSDQAPAPSPDLPSLESFAASLANGDPATVTGFYAAGLFALPVLQQPAADSNFISDQDGTVTQFARPSQYGSIGLLAHNTLSGRHFFHLRLGQEIQVIYGDGRAAAYRIDDIQSYQALSPYDTHSDFVDLNRPDAPILNHTQLFQRVYTTPGQLVLQTCIEANGEPTWGRVFILASPL